MKILIIDDDEDLVNIFTAALGKEGFQTAFSLTGQDGLEKVKIEKPDAILLDQVLPDISGNDILKALKADEATKNIPVILLSNFSQEELVKGAIDQGAVDYLFKYQVEPKDVVLKVKEALKIQ
ncbi:MAG TPA: response regulator [Candidatus Sulfotelmatobacter sp.]|nr:response regulator [Candidatus Sulfotelmatobacter sp.]